MRPKEELERAKKSLHKAEQLLARDISRLRWWKGKEGECARNADTRRKLLLGAMAVYLYREPNRWPSERRSRFVFRRLFARRMRAYLEKPARDLLTTEQLAEGMVAVHLLRRTIPPGLSLCAKRERTKNKALILLGAVLLAEMRANPHSTNILRALIERDYGPKEWRPQDKECLLSLCREIHNRNQQNKEKGKP